MEFKKQQLENILSSFSWEYREIFLEYTHWVNVRFLNGKFEASLDAHNEGVSLLSRGKNSEFVGTFSGIENLDSKAAVFISQNGLSGTLPVSLIWDDAFIMEKKDILPHFDWAISALQELPEMIKKSDFVLSYDVRVLLTHKQHIVANSKGKCHYGSVYYNSLFFILSGQRNGITEETMIRVTGTDILHDFTKENLLDFFQKWISQLDKILDAEPAPSGTMDVVIGAESGGTIIHEAVGHGLEADLQSSSVYRDKIWQLVAHPSVNVIDDPTLWDLRGFYSVDHEWNIPQKTYLIKDGILVSYLHNNKTADLFGVEPTWHGRRQDYSNSLIVRMGSTYLDNGVETKESLISRVKDGIYVAQMWGGQVNEVTGDFVFKVGYGYRIRNGELAEPIRAANIFWNGPEMLKNIQWIANDLGYFDGGTCGKWWQSMPVSDATPSILVKLKVTGIS